MTEANFRKGLQAFIRRRPFKPFQIELVSGDRFIVQHPEALAHSGAVAVYLDPDGEIKLFDSESVSQLADAARRKSW
jgi:hypothetical protein